MHRLIALHPEIRYIVMYCKNLSGHADLDDEKNPKDILATVTDFFDTMIPLLLEKGIQHNQIILDPGMGSFISTEANDSVKILQSIPLLKTRYTLPILIGTSRKGFLTKLSPDK